MKTTVYLNDDSYRWLKKYASNKNRSVNDIVNEAIDSFRKNRLKPREAMLLAALIPQLGSLHKLQPDAIKLITQGEDFTSYITDPAELMQKLYRLIEKE